MRTYVVRLAEQSPPPPDAPPAEPTLCGLVHDVQTGERTPFRSTQELLGLLGPGAGSTRDGRAGAD